MDELMDEIYQAIKAAVDAMEEGCPCGCLEDARDGLEDVMVKIERRGGGAGDCRCF